MHQLRTVTDEVGTNIVLHTCGSTILMGIMCKFNDASFTSESLTEGYGTCLGNLERYMRLSSIARRSYYLLQQSAKRLVPLRHLQVRDRRGRETSSQKEKPSMTQLAIGDGDYQQQHVDRGNRYPETNAQGDVNPTRRSTQHSSEKDIPGPVESSEGTTPGLVPFAGLDLQLGDLQELDENFWLGGSETFNWSVMPSLPQSRALSPGFEFGSDLLLSGISE
jgi:hypothetical protein